MPGHWAVISSKSVTMLAGLLMAGQVPPFPSAQTATDAMVVDGQVRREDKVAQ